MPLARRGRETWARWKFVFSPKWLGWHLCMVVVVAGMLALGDWQYRRATGGNALSWAYTFEWPFFAVMAFIFWVKTLRDQAHPPAHNETEPTPDLPERAMPAATGGGGVIAVYADEHDEELAAYNAYLARLNKR